MDVLAIVELIAMVAKNGTTAVRKGIELYGKQVITVEDVRELEKLVKPARDYFPEKP